jgi:hypothetical protein
VFIGFPVRLSGGLPSRKASAASQKVTLLATHALSQRRIFQDTVKTRRRYSRSAASTFGYHDHLVAGGFAIRLRRSDRKYAGLVATINLRQPLRYMMVVTKGVFLKDMPPLEILNNTWPMAVIAAFTLSFATWLFRRRLA